MDINENWQKGEIDSYSYDIEFAKLSIIVKSTSLL